MMTTIDLIITILVITAGILALWSIPIRDGKWTAARIITLGCLTLLAIGDLWLVTTQDTGSSVSNFLANLPGYPGTFCVFCVALGFILGHLFGRFTPTGEK